MIPRKAGWRKDEARMRHEKVLVTGGSGLLGRFVVQALIGRTDVVVLDLKKPVQDVLYHLADITEIDAVRDAMAGVDAVVHLAGFDDGDAPDEDGYIAVNLNGAWNVLRAAEEAGVNVVAAAASNAATGIGRAGPPDYLPIDEAHPLRPRRAQILR
jgi:nucleoside-diphosphate-sugar epimerase